MIPSAKDYLSSWYQMWAGDLQKNLAAQEALRADEATLRDLVATCEKAFVALFPTAPAPEPTPAPTEAPAPAPEPEPEQPPLTEEPNGSDNGTTAPSDTTSPN